MKGNKIYYAIDIFDRRKNVWHSHKYYSEKQFLVAFREFTKLPHLEVFGYLCEDQKFQSWPLYHT